MFNKKILRVFMLFITVAVIFCACATKKPAEEPAPVVEEISIQQMIREGRTDEVRAQFAKYDVNVIDEFGDTCLHASTEVNNTELISFFLFKGTDPAIKNFDGKTALHIALEKDFSEAVRLLCDNGKSIFIKDTNGLTPAGYIISEKPDYISFLINERSAKEKDESNRNIVHYLVEAENKAALSECIKHNIDISLADKRGYTPLHLAYVNHDNLTCIQIAAMLLEANAMPIKGKYQFFEDAVKTRNPTLRYDDGQTPLHRAAEMNETGIATYLIDRGADISAKDKSGYTPLHVAVYSGSTDIVRLLLAKGADANSQEMYGNTALNLFIPNENAEEIYDLLLENGGNPNSKNLSGDTPLYTAILNNKSKTIIEKLYNKGADINERNKNGITPLAKAVENNLIDQVVFLVNAGADIHATDFNMTSPLARAFGNSPDIVKKTTILKILVNSKNINSRDTNGNSPLHIAVENNADPSQMDYLLSLTDDVNARNKDGNTPLFIAVKKNYQKLGDMLLQKKADIFSTNSENKSPLRIALSSNTDVQEWFLSSEVIKAQDGIGNTPLHLAVEWKYDNAVKLLLEKGAQVNKTNHNGETPLFNAVKVNSLSIISILINKGANKEFRDYFGNTLLHHCVAHNSQDAATLLIQSGANINSKNLAGQTPLYLAVHNCRNLYRDQFSLYARTMKNEEEIKEKIYSNPIYLKRTSMITSLLNKNADINAFDETGKTILMDFITASDAVNCDIKIAALLLKHGALVQMQDMYGDTAYHLGVLSENIKLIKMLYEAGGNPLARNSQGITPFQLSLSSTNEALIKSVLGSNPKLVDSDGNTPLHIAITNRVDTRTLSTLLSLNYPINSRNKNGITPLAIAVKTDLREQAAMLLEKNADPYILDDSGECALTLAIKNHQDILGDIVKFAGKSQDMTGDTILHYAARIASEDTVHRLVNMGLDKNARNILGETPYDMAKRWQREEIAAILK